MNAKFRTQSQVESRINLLIRAAVKWEEYRDRVVHESSAYWLFHDKAVKFHEAARKLMPKGS